MTDWSRAAMLAGEVAGLRYMMGSAIEWASHGHVPPPEVVAAWRERVDGAAGVLGCRGDDGAGAELDARPGLETPGGRFETGRSPVAAGVDDGGVEAPSPSAPPSSEVGP